MKNILILIFVQTVAIFVASALVTFGLFGAERSVAGVLPMMVLYAFYGLPYIVVNATLLGILIDWRTNVTAKN